MGKQKMGEAALTVVMVVVAVVVAVSVARVALFGVPSANVTGGRSAEPLAFWREAANVGHTIEGSADAAVTITMLGDLECPACAGFFRTLEKAVPQWQESVRVIYVSFPLTYHRFGRPAAQAAECAAQVGSLWRWLSVVYEKQDSLGLKTWESYAAEAGIDDVKRVRDCAVAPDTFSALHAAEAFGNKVEIAGVPTVLVNEWRLGSPPSPSQLEETIDLIRAGKGPAGPE